MKETLQVLEIKIIVAISKTLRYELYLLATKMYTVKPVLTTTSEQRPPVNIGQSDPQISQINTSFIGGTSE